MSTVSTENPDLVKRNQVLELEVKHLNNELKLLRDEYESSIDKYYDIYANMENKVVEKTQQLIQAQKMETVGNLAGGLAHDFNNVLSGVRASLSMLKYLSQDGDLKEEACQKLLSLADHSTERAADMVQQLLSLSKKQELKLTEVDLNSVVENVLNICNNTLPKEIEYVVVSPESPCVVNGDQTQLEQVLLNLCVNASHAMTIMRSCSQSYSGKLTISLSEVDAGSPLYGKHPEFERTDSWRLSVSDTGVGITNDDLASIFDPFYTTKDKDKGTGLGLAMVYNIIEQHKGFIDVDSEVDVGTTFSVCLPAHKGAGNSSTKPNSGGKLEAGEGTILIIDDEEIIRQTSTLILEESGYNVITACNGADGVDVFSSNHHLIDAVVLDMAMPKLCGKDCYVELVKINPDVKVLMASGFRQDPRVEECLKMGVKDFLQKPFSIYELASKVKEIIHS